MKKKLEIITVIPSPKPPKPPAKKQNRPPQMTTKQRATVISRLETPEFGEKVLAFEDGK